ncbi:30S ribosomal protein S20 [Marinicellulosiphila megalodicopiae]|uniref:30S ribosomal protein S20 n=1 Tax=Marinicellulosiphila megalodicopiae TaxID=2724896 RepID=UPI003BB05D9F
MANSAGSKKRARQAVVRRAHNASLRSMSRTYVKKIDVQIEANNYEAATEAFKTAQPLLDGLVNKNIISKNRVARMKSRLNARIKALKAA